MEAAYSEIIINMAAIFDSSFARGGNIFCFQHFKKKFIFTFLCNENSYLCKFVVPKINISSILQM